MSIVLTVNKKLIDTNGEIGQSAATTAEVAFSTTLSAERYISVPDPQRPGVYITYVFEFWSTKKDIFASNVIDLRVPESMSITAWYRVATSDGTGVRVLTMFLDSNQAGTLSPIGQVVPATALTADPTFVSTASSNVEITAKGSLDGRDFASWTLLNDTRGDIDRTRLLVPQGGVAVAVAAYKTAAVRIPGPNIHIDLGDVAELLIERIKGKDFVRQVVSTLLGGEAQVTQPAVLATRAIAKSAAQPSLTDLATLETEIEALFRKYGLRKGSITALALGPAEQARPVLRVARMPPTKETADGRTDGSGVTDHEGNDAADDPDGNGSGDSGKTGWSFTLDGAGCWLKYRCLF